MMTLKMKLLRKGLFSKRNNTEPEDEQRDRKSQKFLGRSNPKVVPMRRSMEVTMIKPTSMDDSRDICDYLLSGKAVVLNMEGIHMETAQRIIDFTSGATYSMNEISRRFPITSSLQHLIPWNCPVIFRHPVSRCQLRSGHVQPEHPFIIPKHAADP